MEATTLFPESGKEDDVANFLQGHLYERRCTLLIFAQLPYLQCQRAKLHILLFLSTADKKDFDPVELKIMSESRFRKQIRMDLIRVSAS